MKIRIFALLSAIAMAAALAGCGTRDKGPQSADPPSDGQIDPGETIAPVNFPLEKNITLEFTYFGSLSLTKDLGEMGFLKQMEKDTNITIKWRQYRTGADEAKTLMFASGSLPDAFFGTGISDNDIYTNPNSFMKLNRYLDSDLCGNIQAMFQEYPDLKKSCSHGRTALYTGFPPSSRSVRTMPMRS